MLESRALRLLVLIVGAGPFLRAETRVIDRLANQADAIVVGQMQSGLQTGNAVAFTLSVARTIKGSLASGATVNVSWLCALVANKNLEGNYGLWFLHNAGGGQWTMLGVLQGQYPFEFGYFPLPTGSVPGNLIAPSVSLNVSDRIAVELVSALQISTDYSLKYHLASGLLEIGESTVTPNLYATLRTSPNIDLKFVGLAGMIRTNDTGALNEFGGILNLMSNSPTGAIAGEAICAIRGTDPPIISSLGVIALSTKSAAQTCAAQALKYIPA